MLWPKVQRAIKSILLWKLLVLSVIVILSKTRTFFTDPNPTLMYRNFSLINNEVESHIFVSSIRKVDDTLDLSNLPWWDGGSCSTDTSTETENSLLNFRNLRGYCGYRSFILGEGQKVISYSLFGNYTEYISGLPQILGSISHLYPGWSVRVYTDPRPNKRHLCPLLQKHSHLYICDVTNLPEGPRSLSDVQPRLWRVAALGDPLVDVFLSRDIDSEVLPREAEAVMDFLTSGERLHIMRDNPEHGVPILAGTFGVSQISANMTFLNGIRAMVFQKKYQNYTDQTILANFLYPQLRQSMVAHDSFNCLKFPGSSPFPTQRRGDNFVGNRKYRQQYRDDGVRRECPKECRPRGHGDWRYC